MANGIEKFRLFYDSINKRAGVLHPTLEDPASLKYIQKRKRFTQGIEITTKVANPVRVLTTPNRLKKRVKVLSSKGIVSRSGCLRINLRNYSLKRFFDTNI